MEHAVIDRIVDGKTAVLIVGNDEKEYRYPADKLPAGAAEGTWLILEMKDGEIVSAAVAAEKTAGARSRIQAKIDALRRRSAGRNP